MAKVEFDGENRIIQVIEEPVDGIIDIDVQRDLYSYGKEVWQDYEIFELIGLRFPLSAVGGDPLPGDRQLGTTYFLAADWKIRPYEGNHTLNLIGNFFSVDGTPPITDTVGDWRIFVNQETSALVESRVAQLREIEFASYQNAVWIDGNNGEAGTDYPAGTRQRPVNNLEDAHTIAVERGLTTARFLSAFTIPSNAILPGITIQGNGMSSPPLTFENGSQLPESTIQDANVTGRMTGIIRLTNCHLDNFGGENPAPTGQTVMVEKCLLMGTFSIPPAYFGSLKVLDSWACDTGPIMPILDINENTASYLFRNYSGDMRIKNVTQGNEFEIDLISGTVVIDESCTNMNLEIRGVGHVVNESTSEDVIINDAGLISQNSISRAVWDKPLLAHTGDDTFGAKVQQLLPYGIAKGEPIPNFTFVMVSSSDGVTPMTGLTVTGSRSLNGGTFESIENSVAEIGSGLYRVDLDEADTDADMIMLRFTASGAVDRYVTLMAKER